jgi:hypothetical protein
MANAVILAPDLYSNPPKSAIGGARREYRTMEVTAAQLVTTNIFALAVIPKGHRASHFSLEADDLDTNGAPTLTLDLGILNSYYGAALDAAPALQATKIMEASTVGQAGGHDEPGATLKPMIDIGVDNAHDRIVAVKPAAAAATGAAGTISIGFVLDSD